MNTPKDKLEFGDRYEIANWLSDQIRHAHANEITSERLSDAHKYVHEYCLLDGWGKNVWHTILEDAIKLRDRIQKAKAELADYEDIFIKLGL